MKKNVFYFGGLLVVSAILFIFASCTQEDDFIVDNGLDIDSQVPLTRSGGGDINPNPNVITHAKAGQCGLVALVETKRDNRPNYFSNDYGCTADDYFDSIERDVEKWYRKNENKAYEYGAISNRCLLEVGQSRGLISSELEFSSDSLRVDYFQRGNIPKMVHVMEFDPSAGMVKDHFAYVSSVNGSNITYSNGWGQSKTISISEVLGVFN